MAEQPVPKFFLALMIAVAVLLAAVIAPLAAELILASVLARALWPAQQWLSKRLRGKRGIAAGLLTLAVIILLLGPIATVLTFIIRDGADGVRLISEGLRSPDVTALVDKLPEGARNMVKDGIDRLPRDMGELMGAIQGHTGGAVATARKALTVTGSFAWETALTLIALFFLLARGKELVDWLEDASPLGRAQTSELFATLSKVSYSVVVANGVTAAIQAVCALVGYLIAGVPSPYFLALLTFFCAFIPAIGATAVCLFAALLMLVTGHHYCALFLVLWAIGVVSVVDNLVKPLLMRRGLEVHGAIVFFSMIGGIATFGPTGVLIGPLAVALLLTITRMYHRDYSPENKHVPAVPGLPAETTQLGTTRSV